MNNMIQNDWEIYKKLLLSTKRPGIENLVQWLDNSDFKVAPASTRYHSNYEGGLLKHSLNVYEECTRQQDLIKLFNVPKESIIITSLLHDICKVNYYKMEMRNVKKNGAWVQEPYYTVEDMFPMGHGEKSIIIAQQYIQLTEVEIAMIRNHMGGFVDTSYFSSSNLFNKYPESLILHIADMKATYILESPGMLEDFKAGLDTYLNKN
jgi:HD superfamily phosphohydrolase YqeK